ncbi:MAG: MarR family winged helix-turn-helix transcriptional regulator [Dehalococcoidia bacterium]
MDAHEAGSRGETDLSPSDYRRLAEVRYQIRRFVRFSEEAARAAGIEPQQHQLLLAVKGMPDGRSATIGDVAERLQIQHHSAVELIDRLADRGLVRRERVESDRRQVQLHLTASGDAMLRDLSRHHLDELQSAGPALMAALEALIGDGRANSNDACAQTLS